MNLFSQILRDEGERLRPYLDCCGKYWRECVCQNKGKLTIGVGRNLDDKGISSEESRYFLNNDIEDVLDFIAENIPWAMHLSEARLAVLVNVAFNCGGRGLLRFRKMLTYLRNDEFEKAARELMDSDAARKSPERYGRLREQLLEDRWF